MRVVWLYVLLLTGIIASNVSAGEIKQVNLNDGSVIHGEILSLSDGVYTLKSVALGTIDIEESRIRSITPVTGMKDDIQSIQKQILSDEELLNIVLSFQDDPDFQALLKDPSVMEAINSGDMNVLLSNPTFIKLLSNPDILNIRDKVIR